LGRAAVPARALSKPEPRAPSILSERSEESRIFLDARLRTPMHGYNERARR